MVGVYWKGVILGVTTSIDKFTILMLKIKPYNESDVKLYDECFVEGFNQKNWEDTF